MNLLKELVDEIKDKNVKNRNYKDFSEFLGQKPHKLGIVSTVTPSFLSQCLTSIHELIELENNMKKLETFQSPQQVDEAIQRLLEHYFEDEFKDWEMEDYPEDHIIHSLNILKTLYEQGEPDKVF